MPTDTLHLVPLHATLYTRKSRGAVAPGTTIVSLSTGDGWCPTPQATIEMHHN